MDLEAATQRIGSSAHVLTTDGWWAAVTIKGAKSAYGHIRYVVTDGIRTATVDENRLNFSGFNQAQTLDGSLDLNASGREDVVHPPTDGA